MRTVYKHVIITGAAQALGANLARYFVQRGASVSLIDTERTLLSTAVETLQPFKLQTQQRIEIASAQVKKRNELEQAINDLVMRNGPCDILINAASHSTPLALHESTETYEHMINQNYLSVLYAIQSVLPSMISRRSGNIVAFTLTPHSLSKYVSSATSASHLAIQGLLRTLQREIKTYHITTSLVYIPGSWIKASQQPHLTLEPGRVERIGAQLLEGKKYIYPDWKIASSLRISRAIQFLAEPSKFKRPKLNNQTEAPSELTDSSLTDSSAHSE